MPICFASPMDTMFARRRYGCAPGAFYCAPGRRAFHSPCDPCGPRLACSSFFPVLFFFLMLPLLGPLIRFGLMFLAINWMLNTFGCLAAAAFEGTSSCCTNPCGENTEKRAKESTEHEATEEIDGSSVRIVKTDAEVRIVVAAPGVRSSDLEVRTQTNGRIIVKGATKRADEVWKVDRSLELSPALNAELDSAHASHEDGQVTITLKRKGGKRIPIVAAGGATSTGAVEPAAAQPAAAQPKGDKVDEYESTAQEDASAPSSSDEWEALPKDKIV